MAAYAEVGARWRMIAQRVPGRSDDAVRNRWSRLVKWQAEEDAEEVGEAEGRLPGELCRANAPPKPKRQGSEPFTARLGWSQNEDRIIVQGVAEFGHRWQRISELLSSKRSEHAIRNRWHRLWMAALDGRGGVLSKVVDRAGVRTFEAGAEGRGPEVAATPVPLLGDRQDTMFRNAGGALGAGARDEHSQQMVAEQLALQYGQGQFVYAVAPTQHGQERQAVTFGPDCQALDNMLMMEV